MILDRIGQTPLHKVTRFDTGICELFLKLECENPTGSIKDRIALAMVANAPKGAVLVEASSGNTGISLALVASQKGYALTVVVNDKVSAEKIAHMKAFGAEVIVTRSDARKGEPEYYQDLAQRIAGERGAIFVNQFANPENPRAHETTTAPEIWRQMDERVDAIIVGAGSGGTLTGLGRFFADKNVALILADPVGSIYAPFVKTKTLVEPGRWLVEGVGKDHVPKNCELGYAKKAISVADKDSVHAVRELLKQEGIFGGASSGMLLHAALQYCLAQTTPKRVVTFVCDSGNKYLSKIFNDAWLMEKGLA